jgi:hypothetical protein
VTSIGLAASIVISMGSVAWGFAEAGIVVFARWIIIFGVVWLFTQWRGLEWFSSLGLFVAILASVFGVWIGLMPGWMLSGSIFALLAWDLTDFRHRMQSIAIDDDARGMERRHIARIWLLSLVGLLLASISMLLRTHFTFAWGVLLVFVILLGLGQLVAWIRK